MLLFPVGNDAVLAAAVFPETGVPDLPGANPPAQAQAQAPAMTQAPAPVPAPAPPIPGQASNMNAQVLALLQKMSPQQREAILGRWRQQGRAPHAATAGAAAGPSTSGVTNPITTNPANPIGPNTVPASFVGGSWPSAGGMPGIGMGQQQGIQQNVNVPPPGMASAAGIGANIDFAQMMAAIQRQRQQQAGMPPPPGSGGPPTF